MWSYDNKSHFYTDDDIVKDILFAYCLGKPFWWNDFFGWRLTKGNICYFTVPNKKDAKEIYDMIRSIK